MRPTATGEIATRGGEAEMLGDCDRDIGAERVEGAVRQIDDPADAEDQRQP